MKERAREREREREREIHLLSSVLSCEVAPWLHMQLQTARNAVQRTSTRMFRVLGL